MQTLFSALGGILLLLALAVSIQMLSRTQWFRRLLFPDVALLVIAGVFVSLLAQLARLPLQTWLHPVSPSFIMTGAASLIILFGGSELTPHVVRVVWKPILLLSTVGVAVSTVVVGVFVFASGIGQLSFISALLLGAVLAGTDPAVLVSVLDQVPINERAREMLIAESALNDPLSAIIASTLIVLIVPDHPSLASAVLASGKQIAFALLIGVSMGFASRKIAWTVWKESALTRVTVLFLATFGLCLWSGASPYLSCFVTGFLAQPLQTASPSQHPTRQGRDRDRIHNLLFFTRSYIFLLLGLSVHVATNIRLLTASVAIALTLIVIARPLSVWVVKWLSGRALTRMEAVFMGMNRQTGVIPALFAALLVQMKIPHANLIQDTVTITILFTSVLLLPLFAAVARLCHMTTTD